MGFCLNSGHRRPQYPHQISKIGLVCRHVALFRLSIHNGAMGILERVSALAKRRGFIYPSSEIYGGLQGVWDYGPLGVLFKNNIKQEWWRTMVQARDDVVGLDAAIFMNPKVWEASGHTEAFTDPLVECKKCKRRFRADHL